MPSTARTDLKSRASPCTTMSFAAAIRPATLPTHDSPTAPDGDARLSPRPSVHALERKARRDDAATVHPVRDVDGVVLPVGAGDADQDRGPAPEAEAAFGPEIA